jgi:hypothetical protein
MLGCHHAGRAARLRRSRATWRAPSRRRAGRRHPPPRGHEATHQRGTTPYPRSSAVYRSDWPLAAPSRRGTKVGSAWRGPSLAYPRCAASGCRPRMTEPRPVPRERVRRAAEIRQSPVRPIPYSGRHDLSDDAAVGWPPGWPTPTRVMKSPFCRDNRVVPAAGGWTEARRMPKVGGGCVARRDANSASSAKSGNLGAPADRRDRAPPARRDPTRRTVRRRIYTARAEAPSHVGGTPTPPTR